MCCLRMHGLHARVYAIPATPAVTTTCPPPAVTSSLVKTISMHLAAVSSGRLLARPSRPSPRVVSRSIVKTRAGYDDRPSLCPFGALF